MKNKIILFGILSMFSVTAIALPIHIKQKMPYLKARQKLLDDGWQTMSMHVFPNGTPNCDHGHIDNQNCTYLEIDSCSGTGMGYCMMYFHDGEGKFLEITTVGGHPPSEPSEPSEEREETVIESWGLSKKQPQIDVSDENR